MRRALVIVGKAPLAGPTKTRLVPPLSPDDAAALYRGFLLDSVALGLELGWERVSVVHPRGRRPALGRAAAAASHLLEQRGAGSCRRPAVCLRASPGRGFRPSGAHRQRQSDAAARADRARRARRWTTIDLCIGPSADGGYYLIGLREPHLGVFDAIDWSTSRVYGQTLAQAARSGCACTAVPGVVRRRRARPISTRLQRELAASRLSRGAAYARRAARVRCSDQTSLRQAGPAASASRPERSA